MAARRYSVLFVIAKIPARVGRVAAVRLGRWQRPGDTALWADLVTADTLILGSCEIREEEVQRHGRPSPYSEEFRADVVRLVVDSAPRQSSCCETWTRRSHWAVQTARTT
jgi:hypothetical protein